MDLGASQLSQPFKWLPFDVVPLRFFLLAKNVSHSSCPVPERFDAFFSAVDAVMESIGEYLLQERYWQLSAHTGVMLFESVRAERVLRTVDELVRSFRPV